MNATYQYKVGAKLRTVIGHESAYTITEFTKVPESEYANTYARYNFVAEDKSIKVKKLDIKTLKHVKAHPRIVGWIDERGCWFS